MLCLQGLVLGKLRLVFGKHCRVCVLLLDGGVVRRSFGGLGHFRREGISVFVGPDLLVKLRVNLLLGVSLCFVDVHSVHVEEIVVAGHSGLGHSVVRLAVNIIKHPLQRFLGHGVLVGHGLGGLLAKLVGDLEAAGNVKSTVDDLRKHLDAVLVLAVEIFLHFGHILRLAEGFIVQSLSGKIHLAESLIQEIVEVVGIYGHAVHLADDLLACRRVVISGRLFGFLRPIRGHIGI